LSEAELIKTPARGELRSSSLVVAWSEDAGKLGPKVVAYLNRKLGSQEMAEIDPVGFFPLDGVSVEADVAQFPESKFYWSRERNLMVLRSNPPRWDFETPPGQRPTLSSFLLWVAKRRNIPGANLWVPVPFYLAGGNDPLAWRKAAGFLDAHLRLGIDFQDLDKEVAEQNREIAEYRGRFPEIDSYMNRLESNLSLSADESEKLLQGIEELLRKRH